MDTNNDRWGFSSSQIPGTLNRGYWPAFSVSQARRDYGLYSRPAGFHSFHQFSFFIYPRLDRRDNERRATLRQTRSGASLALLRPLCSMRRTSSGHVSPFGPKDRAKTERRNLNEKEDSCQEDTILAPVRGPPHGLSLPQSPRHPHPLRSAPSSPEFVRVRMKKGGAKTGNMVKRGY